MKLVFVHGSGMSSVVWQQQLQQFPNAKLINLPGRLGIEAARELDAYVDVLSSELAKLDEEYVLVGHSLGSALVLQLALKPVGLLKGIVLIGAGARLRVMPEMLEALANSAQQDNKLPSLMLSMNDQVAEPLRSQINADMCNHGAAVMLQDLKICDGFDVMEQLSTISIPALIVVGDKDQMTPPKYAEFLAKELPNATMKLIGGGTHMVFAEQAEAVNQLIQDFISRLEENE